MGTAIKHHVPDWVKPSFVIFDTRALWRSVLWRSVLNAAWHRMLYSCTHCGNHGRQRVKVRSCSCCRLSDSWLRVCVLHNCLLIVLFRCIHIAQYCSRCYWFASSSLGNICSPWLNGSTNGDAVWHMYWSPPVPHRFGWRLQSLSEYTFVKFCGLRHRNLSFVIDAPVYRHVQGDPGFPFV